MGDRGSALFEVLVVGLVGALLMSQVIISANKLHVAGDRATATAQAAAIWAARSGDAETARGYAESLYPEADVSAWIDGGAIHVEVRRSVALLGPDTGPLRVTVTGRGVAAPSPFRSDG